MRYFYLMEIPKNLITNVNVFKKSLLLKLYVIRNPYSKCTYTIVCVCLCKNWTSINYLLSKKIMGKNPKLIIVGGFQLTIARKWNVSNLFINGISNSWFIIDERNSPCLLKSLLIAKTSVVIFFFLHLLQIIAITFLYTFFLFWPRKSLQFTWRNKTLFYNYNVGSI